MGVDHLAGRCVAFMFFVIGISCATAQVTTSGFLNQPRPEAPGTLLSHPLLNDSEAIGRTTTLNYLNGWLIVGGEQPGSRPGSDWQLRVYDISDPANPIRYMPDDFGLVYPNNSWIYGNHGWNAHGTARHNNLLLPDPIRVNGFGGLVERAGENGVPGMTNLPLWYSRASQAGPWDATMLWYGTPDQPFEIARIELDQNNFSQRRVLATFDHVGPFGGGEWHPIFFGDLLIYVRSGGSGSDGVVVYRLAYHNMDDADPNNDSITPQFVGSLTGGFQAYWPNLFSDGTGLYVIGAATDLVLGADITSATMPGQDPDIRTVASLSIPGLSNAPYPTYQDRFAFIHHQKIDMTRFLAGDANPVVLALNELNPPRPAEAPSLPAQSIVGVDTSQMSLPLGNLWITGGYPIPETNQGMGVWVHQQEPDTTPPRVSFHIPQANRTQYPQHAPLSFLLHEHGRNGGPQNGVDFLVRPVLASEQLGTAIDGFLIHDFSGTLTFTPDPPLEADTTYQVDFTSNPAEHIGFRDAAGNYIEPYSFRFSTGGGINAMPPPAFTSVTASNAIPAPGETIVITANALGDGPLEYRFNLEGSWGAWSHTNSASHAYTTEGRPRALVQVRDIHGAIVTDSVRLLVIEPLAPGPRPTQSSTLAVGDDPGGRRVWVVNPDANTVSVLDALTGALVAEHPVGQDPRGIARDHVGRYWVSCHDSDEMRVLHHDGSLFATLPLAYGSAPFGVVPSPDGQFVYVSLFGAAELVRFSAAAPGAPPVLQPTLSTPRAMAVSADGQRVLVTRFISPDFHGQVAEHDGTSLAHVRTINLGVSISWDSGDRAGGTPNYLAGIAISPDGSRAAVVSKQDNVHRGELFGVGDLTHETTVRAVISLIDLNTNQEIPNTRRDIDNSDSPSAVAWSPLGDTVLVTLQGNNRLVGLDALGLGPVPGGSTALSTETSPAVLMLDLGTGLAPQGLLLDPISQRLFTQNFMGRSVTVRDAAPFLTHNLTSFPPMATNATVTTELLSPEVLLGKQIFYNAADPRMSADSYISCATCHIDGGHDGRAWDFTGRGEGLRRTTDLRGRSGTGHGNVHWSGNFDEIQDFEHDIRGPFGGTGFLSLSSEDFARLHPSPATGKAGQSADLDALAAYVASLGHEHTPRSPHREDNGSLTPTALAGRAVFMGQNCASCHQGEQRTNSALGAVGAHPLVNVGTLSLLSGQRLGGPLLGIDVPTLHGLHATQTFLHHGEAKSLDAVFSSMGGTVLLAAEASFITPPGHPASISGMASWQFNPAQGGGGFTRGLLGGDMVSITHVPGEPEQPRVRFSGVDGGSGGPARIAVRYEKQYEDASAVLRVNGIDYPFPLLRPSPNFGWHVAGWRWHTIDVTLEPGPSNTVDVVVGLPESNAFFLNAILVSNADVLAAAQPHRAVLDLSAPDRAALIAYLQQLDGRDDHGSPLPSPSPATPQPPSILDGPYDITLAIGDSLNYQVTLAGEGPFTYEWRRGTTIIGTNSPFLHIPNVQPDDAGAYTVTVTSEHGMAESEPATLTINPALSITTLSLPEGMIAQPYTALVDASGGVGNRTWSLVSGVLPPGLSLAASGVISGTPSVAARAEIVVRVTDDTAHTTRALSVNIAPTGGFVNDPDLILHYTFDEGSGTRIWDLSPAGNNHSTDHASAHWVTGGRLGGAYGPGAPDAPIANFIPENQSDLDFDPTADEFTITTWVRTTSSGNYQIVVGKDGGDPYRVQYRIWTVDPATRLEAIAGNQYGGGINAPQLNNGDWHLIAMVNVNDGGSWRTRLYLNDGSLFADYPTGNGGTAPAPMRVGGMSGGWNEWNGQLDDFRIYRRALTPAEIGELYAGASSMPTVQISPAPGQETPFNRPFAEWDIHFSRPVTGLDANDFQIGGTAGHSARTLTEITAGLHYRLRIAGFAQPGTLSAHLPGGSVLALDNNEPSTASNISELTYFVPTPDDVAALSDEFDDATSLLHWQRNHVAEGWNADKLEVFDIDSSAPGHMRMMPYSSSWYQDFTGAYAYKEVSGDFIVTIDLDVLNRAGTGRPNQEFSLTGLMIRTPRGLSNAAPTPDPGPGVVLPWPPPAEGQPLHYTTPWQPGTENYIFLSYGFGSAGLTQPDGNNPNRWHYEVKTTTNGVSTLYPRTHGVPENEPNASLQIARVGSTFLLLRRHGNGPWIIENRFERPDMPATLQVGITTYTDWNTVSAGWNFSDPTQPFHQNRITNTTGTPDLVADIDFFRLRRPDTLLTQGPLQAAPVTGPNGPVVTLQGSPLESLLGDAAMVPPPPPSQSYEQWLGDHLSATSLADPAMTDPEAHTFNAALPNIFHYVLGGDPIALPPALLPVTDEQGNILMRYAVTRNPLAVGWRLTAQTTTELGTWLDSATSDHGQPFTGTGITGLLQGPPARYLIGPPTGHPESDLRYYRTITTPISP
jgi:YVTN family beta-propeller protein